MIEDQNGEIVPQFFSKMGFKVETASRSRLPQHPVDITQILPGNRSVSERMIDRRHDEEAFFTPERHVHVGIRHDTFDKRQVELIVSKCPDHFVGVSDTDSGEAPTAAAKIRK